MVLSGRPSPSKLSSAGSSPVRGNTAGWTEALRRASSLGEAQSVQASRAGSGSLGGTLPPTVSKGFIRRVQDVPDLSLEVALGNMPKIKSCVERFGIDVNTCGHDGLIPMHVAAGRGNMQVCKYLVERRGDIFAKSNDGMTPLHMAARGGHIDILKMFKDCEGFYIADLDIRTYDGWSCLHFACRDGRRSVFDFLVHETSRTEAIMDVDLDARTFDGRTPLLIAAEAGNTEMVENLIRTGADTSAVCWSERHGFEGLGAVHLAAMMGHKEIVSNLALSGEDLDKKTTGGWTPLMLATHAGFTGVVKILVNAGCDVTAKTKDEEHTALDLAKRHKNTEIVDIILKELELGG